MKKECYAYSLKVKKVAEPDWPYNGQVLSSPEAVYNFSKELHDLDTETFIVLYLDSKNKLISMSSQPGTVDQTAVYPREIAKQALLSSCSSVLMLHNHPSGIVHPSSSDKDLTKQLKEALSLFQIRTHDHMIVSEEGYFSFAKEGWL